MEGSSAALRGSRLRGWRAVCIGIGGAGSIRTSLTMQPSPDAIEPLLTVLRVLGVLFGIFCLVLAVTGLVAGQRATQK